MNKRKNFFWCLLLSVCLLIFWSNIEAQVVDSQVKNRAKRLIVKINSPAGVGGGIIFGERGGYLFIATAYHVVSQGVESVEFEMYRNVPVPAQSFYNDGGLDLTLLRVDLQDPHLSDFPIDQLPLQEIGYTEAVSDMQVFPVGHPYGDLWEIPSGLGRIESVVGSNFEFEFPCEPGHSGGGVFTQSGNLVGMSVKRATPNICRALKFTTIANVIKNQGGVLQLASRDEFKLPDFSNQSERDAYEFLEKACEPHPCVRVQTQQETSDIVESGRIIRTEPGRNTEVRRGDMVMLVVSNGPAPLEYPRDHNGRSKGLSRFIFAESSFYRGFLVVMNDQKAPFNDHRIRVAVDYLLPYSNLQGVVGDEPPSNPVTGYTLRRTDARRYMEEAGYPHGSLSVSLLVGSELTFYERWGEIISQALRSDGIGVTVTALQSNEVVNRVKSGNYQMAIVQVNRFFPQSAPQENATVEIVSVECLQDYKLKVKIRIVSDGGIKNYTVGPTWTGAGRVEKVFSSSYPRVIEKAVILDKKIRSDSQRHPLQVGLWVETVESRFTLSDFALEPQGKCPGH